MRRSGPDSPSRSPSRSRPADWPGSSAAAANASSWFAGGVVAYRAESKFRVLSVTEGPVMSARCAVEMAKGVRDLFHADVSVSTTGVGGPTAEEGLPAGTVFIAVAEAGASNSTCIRLDGDVEDVVHGAVQAGLEMLLSLLKQRPQALPA